MQNRATSHSGSVLTLKNAAQFIAVVLLVSGLLVYFQADYRKSVATASETMIKEEQVRFFNMKNKLELMFRIMYQNIRTISLLPSVRNIEGGNLPEGVESAVEEGRFEKTSQDTVQQIYNNLAANVSVSEVYCLTDGFDPDSGETPFFMYDELVLKAKSGEEGAEEVNEDFPEELETEEYDWFKVQIPALKSRYPHFNFNSLDEIPAFMSPPVRTCDNTQYVSKKQGNVSDATGIMMVVPFYDYSEMFRGIIAAIFRLNIFEAALLDRKSIPIGEEEIKAAREHGQLLPEDKGRFLLACDELKIRVFDRRNETLLETFRRADSEGWAHKDKDYLIDKIEAPVAHELKLFYVFDPQQIEKIKKSAWTNMVTRSALVVALGLVLIYLMWQSAKRKRHVAELSELLVSASEELSTASGQIAKSSENLSQTASEQAASLQQTSSSLEQVSDVALRNVESAMKAKTMANEAKVAADQSNQDMVSIQQAMVAVNESSSKITKIISTIEGIAAQTNMLALNAAVEAARAGEHGSGFAVVAGEVRSLARRSSEAVKEISRVVEGSVTSVDETQRIVKQAVKSLTSIMAMSRDVADLVTKIANENKAQSENIAEVKTAVTQIDKATQMNASTAEESSAMVNDLNNQVDALKAVIADLGKLVGGGGQDATVHRIAQRPPAKQLPKA